MDKIYISILRISLSASVIRRMSAPDLCLSFGLLLATVVQSRMLLLTYVNRLEKRRS